MTNSFSPAVIEDGKNVLLGEGVLIYDYGNTDVVVGATRGGTKLEIDWIKKEVGFDGALGPTKNMRRTERFVAKLIVNFLKLTYVNMAYGLNVTVSDGTDQDGTYKKTSFNTTFAAADVMSNLTFKGWKADGTYCVIKLENALNIDNISLEFKEKDEVISEMTYTGFYTYAAPTTPPIKFLDEIAA